VSDDTSILELIREARAQQDQMPGTWPAKRELANAIRELNHCLAATDAPEDELLAIAAAVRTAARRFTGQPEMENPPGVAEMSLSSGMEVFRDRSPLVGMANPLAPPATLAVDRSAERVYGEVFFGPAYQGAPGCVHGGFVAAVFDEALGMATVFSGRPGMTGWIRVSYRKPTPLETTLRVVARMDGIEGRKISASAELLSGKTVVAEATGLFISIPLEKFAELKEAERQRKAVSD